MAGRKPKRKREREPEKAQERAPEPETPEREPERTAEREPEPEQKRAPESEQKRAPERALTRAPEHAPEPTKSEHDPMDKDVNTRSIVKLGLALAAVVAGVLIALGPFTRWMMGPEPTDKAPMPLATELSRVPPEPRLQPVPTAQLQALRAYEKERLSSYGWVDKNKGITHIPVDRAIALMAERGLPVRPEGAKPADHGLTVPTDSSLGKPKKAEGEEMP